MSKMGNILVEGGSLDSLNDMMSSHPHKYDYQRAKCEDPEIINQWFDLVQDTQ
jgi:hypothetical protein